jgi:hypothetical protein
MHKRFLYGYFAATVTAWCVTVIAESCFEWQNAHQIPSMGLRDACITIWSVSSVGVIVLQLAGLAAMAFPPRTIRDGLTSRARLAVALFAIVLLLTSPWAFILLVVLRGGTLG